MYVRKLHVDILFSVLLLLSRDTLEKVSQSTFIFLTIIRFWFCYLNKSEHNAYYTPTLTLSELLMFICDVSLASEFSEKQIKSSPEEISILLTK